jgi:uncharacterized protein DUF222
VVALGTMATRLDAKWCGLIGEWDHRGLWGDDGSRSPATRLAREAHRCKQECGRLVRRARQLPTMPVAAEAYAAGDICGAHVDLVASCDREWRNAEFADSEEFLVDLCRTPLFHVAQQGIAYWQQLADRKAADDDADVLHQRRHLHASKTWRGTGVLDGVLDPVGFEVFHTELTRIDEELRLQDRRDGAQRTAAQRRADALIEMATRSAIAPADGLRARPLFTVTIGIDPFKHLCELASGSVIAPGLLLPYLAEADIERIVYDPPNRRFEASHRRRFDGAIRRIIKVRDRHCQHSSGCDVPASKCDVDHIEPHSRGGITCLCRGELKCDYHNRILKRATPPGRYTTHACPHPEHHSPPAVGSHDDSRAPPEAG